MVAIWLLPFSGLLLATDAIAETMYVTDNLRLGLHRAADTSDRAFRTLESGQELEVVNQTRNYANVQLPDGTTGYVKIAYLVDEKPAKLIVAETAAQRDALEDELRETKAAFARPAETIDRLQLELATVNASLEEQSAEVASLTESVDEYRRRQEQYRFSLPASWVAGAFFVALLLGFLGGLWWVDSRSRKRHGGIRIY